jgi:hypothetical protein
MKPHICSLDYWLSKYKYWSAFCVSLLAKHVVSTKLHSLSNMRESKKQFFSRKNCGENNSNSKGYHKYFNNYLKTDVRWTGQMSTYVEWHKQLVPGKGGSVANFCSFWTPRVAPFGAWTFVHPRLVLLNIQPALISWSPKNITWSTSLLRPCNDKS